MLGYLDRLFSTGETGLKACSRPCWLVVSMKHVQKEKEKIVSKVAVRGEGKSLVTQRLESGKEPRPRRGTQLPALGLRFPRRRVNKAASNTPEEHSRDPGQLAVGG